MRGEILSVGTELLLGQIVNTNARELALRLAEAGVFVYYQVTVGDNRQRLLATYREALRRSDVIVVTGGLGPTYDDLTKETLAEALGVPLVLDEQAIDELRAWFASRGLKMTAIQEKQALCPVGAELLRNPVGSAPGVLWQKDGKLVALLPGPPHEMRTIFEESVFPRIRTMSGEHLQSRVLHVAGIGEASVQERLTDLMAGENPTIAPYAKLAEVELRLTARAASDDEAQAMLRPLVREVRRRLGWHVYGEGDVRLEDAVGEELARQRLTIATVESVTGGLVASRLVGHAGASRYVQGGLVAYRLEQKESWLGLSAETIGDGVSAELAQELARAAAWRFGADVGIGTCGFAGPAGRQVGLVYVAIAGRRGERVRELRLGATREEIRQRAAQWALTMLWQQLQEEA